MKSVVEPPRTVPLVDVQGRINPKWLAWLEQLGGDDEVSGTTKPLVGGAWAKSAGVNVYTVPDNVRRTTIDAATVVNTDSSARTLTVYVVPSGAAMTDEHMIVKSESIDAAKTTQLPELVYHTLSKGDVIHVVGSVDDKLAIRISGTEIT